MENGSYPHQHADDVTKGSKEQEVKQKDEEESKGAHKRSISGGFLGSLPFLRPSTKDVAPPTSPKREEKRHVENEEGTKRGSSLANALRQSQGRKRRGSLRKAAMLGTKNMLRSRSNSLRSPAKPPAIDTHMNATAPDEATPRRFSYDNESLNSSSDSGWPPVGKLSVSTSTISSTTSHDDADLTPRLLASPLTSPVGPYASTTDDDEALSFYRPSASGSGAYIAQGPGPGISLQRRRSNRGASQHPHSSLTIVSTPADLLEQDDWDYNETEWWGWIILAATWIVFVVGMGSCLGVWSWAWDVGETPYAPPELEDDPTLPIVGYYPALIVCTAVMSWVWVVVAWVGMKYFRHAKVVGEEG